MTAHIRIPAPDPIGDVVPGEPPVPINMWYVPAARAGETMSAALAERLVMNYTHGRRLVLDVTDGEQLARAAHAARRRHARRRPADLAAGTDLAALVVAGWPTDGADVEALLAGCAFRLMAGGCVAVVLAAGDLTVNQMVIGAARTAGLSYLQHIVAAHELSAQVGRLGDGKIHRRVHTDVLIFSRSVWNAGV